MYFTYEYRYLCAYVYVHIYTYTCKRERGWEKKSLIPKMPRHMDEALPGGVMDKAMAPS